MQEGYGYAQHGNNNHKNTLDTYIVYLYALLCPREHLEKNFPGKISMSELTLQCNIITVQLTLYHSSKIKLTHFSTLN